MFHETIFPDSSPVQPIFLPFSTLEYQINEVSEQASKNQFCPKEIQELHEYALDLQEAIHFNPVSLRSFQSNSELKNTVEETDQIGRAHV